MFETIVKKVKKTDATAREGAAASTASPDALGKELLDLLGKRKEALTEADNKRIAELMNMKHPTQINLNAKDNFGYTPMHQAAKNGKTETVQALIAAGADKDAKDEYGRTPMHWAAENGRTETVQELIAAGADKNAKDNRGDTPMHWAALVGKTKTVQALIAAGADKEARNRLGDTPLYEAARYGYTEAVQALIKAGADKEAKDIDGRTPMHWAAENGRTETVQALIDAKVDINAKDNFGYTPMHQAAENGETETVQALIAAGADKDAKSNDGTTPMYLAAYNGRTETVQALIDAKVDVNAKDEYNGDTPLHWAAYKGHIEMVKALIAAGADKEAKNEDGSTPMHWAAHEGKTETVQALIAAGADKEAKDNDGETPLHQAARMGETKTVQALIAAGADKEAKNNDGKTAADLLEETIKEDRAAGEDVAALEATLKTLRPAEAEGTTVNANASGAERTGTGADAGSEGGETPTAEPAKPTAEPQPLSDEQKALRSSLDAAVDESKSRAEQAAALAEVRKQLRTDPTVAQGMLKDLPEPQREALTSSVDAVIAEDNAKPEGERMGADQRAACDTLKKDLAKPTAEPAKPTAEPEKPTAEPAAPTAEPEKPTAEPEKPTAEPEKPTAEEGPTNSGKPEKKPTDAKPEKSFQDRFKETMERKDLTPEEYEQALKELNAKKAELGEEASRSLYFSAAAHATRHANDAAKADAFKKATGVDHQSYMNDSLAQISPEEQAETAALGITGGKAGETTHTQMSRYTEETTEGRKAHDHAKARVDRWSKGGARVSGVKLDAKTTEIMRANLKKGLQGRGYSEEEAERQANMLLYKMVQANKLYHPQEFVTVDGQKKRAGEVLGAPAQGDKPAMNHRDALRVLADPNATPEQLSQAMVSVDNVEGAISDEGYAILNVRAGQGRSFNTSKKAGYTRGGALTASEQRAADAELFQAVERGDIDGINRATARGADLNAVREVEVDGKKVRQTPLDVAGPQLKKGMVRAGAKSAAAVEVDQIKKSLENKDLTPEQYKALVERIQQLGQEAGNDQSKLAEVKALQMAAARYAELHVIAAASGDESMQATADPKFAAIYEETFKQKPSDTMNGAMPSSTKPEVENGKGAPATPRTDGAEKPSEDEATIPSGETETGRKLTESGEHKPNASGMLGRAASHVADGAEVDPNLIAAHNAASKDNS